MWLGVGGWCGGMVGGWFVGLVEWWRWGGSRDGVRARGEGSGVGVGGGLGAQLGQLA